MARLAGLLGALLLLGVQPAASQSGGAGGLPDLVDLALGWARGEYRAPLVCTFGGEPRRGLRKVVIAPGRPTTGARVDRIRFFDLAPGRASRCVNALGEPEPNLEGSVLITLRARSRPDVANRDFKEALRRDGGFDFAVVSGVLRITPISADGARPRTVDFAGGTARLAAVRRGSDAARMLADFRSPRKLVLTLRSPGGEEIRLHLFQTGPR